MNENPENLQPKDTTRADKVRVLSARAVQLRHELNGVMDELAEVSSIHYPAPEASVETKFFSPEVLTVVEQAKAFTREAGHSKAGREHVLYAFASGAGGEIIKKGLESCDTTPEAVQSAIKYIDGSGDYIKPHDARSAHTVDTVGDVVEPHTSGFQALAANQRFMGLTPNTDAVFSMALKESDGKEDVTADDILRILLREEGRMEPDFRDKDQKETRFMQVVHHISPDLTINNLRDSVLSASRMASEIEEL